MDRKLTPIKNITKSTKNWTAKVKVLEKWRPRTAQHSPLKFQKLILADAEGSRVQATIFDENIQKLEGTLEVYNTYLISNAEVKFVPPQFRKIDFEWQWQINASTLIQTFDESSSHQDFLNLDFVPFEQFEQHLGEQTAIDILAAVAQVQTPKVLNKPGNPRAQEIIVINQEMKPIILTFWDDFITKEGTQLLQNTDPYPVLIGIQVKVTPYNGHSLSSRPGSSFMIDPNTLAAHALKAWCNANNEIVQQLCDEFLAKPIIRTVPDPKDDDFIPINDLPKIPEMVESQTYWIRAKISIVTSDQEFWYMSCSSCRKSISATSETIFDCFNCNTKKVMAKPRVKFEVQLTDGSGSMTATMFENHAKEYFLVDGNTLMKYAAENTENVIAVFPKLALQNEYRIQLKPREYPSRGVKALTYNINTIKPTLSENKENDDPLTKARASPSLEIKAKKKLFSKDDKPTTP